MLKLPNIQGKHKYPHIRDKRTSDTVLLYYKERQVEEKVEAVILIK